ncbi:hypothetical protein ACKF11_12770 [Methylobacillus sp. Pita2]|uniref:hypothetical protein n=1 Tax=Methylobacillus sp. Pita2 TaxID=3383245 RepID=UPI0038B54EC6
MSAFSRSKSMTSSQTSEVDPAAEEVKVDTPAIRAGMSFASQNKVVDPNEYALDHPSMFKRIHYMSEDGTSQLVLVEGSGIVDLVTNESANGWYIKAGKYGGDRFHFVDGRWHHDHEPACILKDDKGVIWYKNGLMHRDNGPAVELVTTGGDIRKSWYRNGLRHRTDGPAHQVTREDGVEFEMYYQNDVLHRTDGPAMTIMDAAGNTISAEYRVQGLLHREGGPAYQSGELMEFRQEGELHNLEGPALIQPGKTPLYYLQGLEVTAAEQRKAYLENRQASIGKSKKTTGPTPARSETQKQSDMVRKIDGWVSKREAKNKSPRP